VLPCDVGCKALAPTPVAGSNPTPRIMQHPSYACEAPNAPFPHITPGPLPLTPAGRFAGAHASAHQLPFTGPQVALVQTVQYCPRYPILQPATHALRCRG
jgi:hypothetical protein